VGSRKHEQYARWVLLSSLRHTSILKNVFWYLSSVANIQWNPPSIFFWRNLFVPCELWKILIRGLCQNQIKLLLWLQKWYIYLIFKPDDVFLQSILYLYIYLMGQKRKHLRSKLKLCFHYTGDSVGLNFCWHGVWWWPIVR
jgi:hypothetical protein